MTANGRQYGMKRITSDFVLTRNVVETGENRPKYTLHCFLLYCVLWAGHYHFKAPLNQL